MPRTPRAIIPFGLKLLLILATLGLTAFVFAEDAQCGEDGQECPEEEIIVEGERPDDDDVDYDQYNECMRYLNDDRMCSGGAVGVNENVRPTAFEQEAPEVNYNDVYVGLACAVSYVVPGMSPLCDPGQCPDWLIAATALGGVMGQISTISYGPDKMDLIDALVRDAPKNVVKVVRTATGVTLTINLTIFGYCIIRGL